MGVLGVGGEVEFGRPLRSPGAVWSACIFGGVMLLIGATQISRSAALTATCFVLGVGIIGLFTIWSAMWLTPSGVKVRNPTRAFSLSWDQINGFRLGGRWFLHNSLQVDLLDGSSRHVFAIQRPNYSLGKPDAWEPRAVARLNELLRERRDPTSETQSL